MRGCHWLEVSSGGGPHLLPRIKWNNFSGEKRQLARKKENCTGYKKMMGGAIFMEKGNGDSCEQGEKRISTSRDSAIHPRSEAECCFLFFAFFSMSPFPIIHLFLPLSSFFFLLSSPSSFTFQRNLPFSISKRGA